MTEKAQHIHRLRIQTPEQEAVERALRERFQQEKPALQDLAHRGDITQVVTRGEYWDAQRQRYSPVAHVPRSPMG